MEGCASDLLIYDLIPGVGAVPDGGSVFRELHRAGEMKGLHLQDARASGKPSQMDSSRC